MRNKLLLLTLFSGLIVFSTSCKKEKPEEINPNFVVKEIADSPDGVREAEYIIINIEGIKNAVGLMNIALYNSESSFNDPNKAFREYFIDVSSKSMTIKLDSIPPGEYAFGLFHDENKNYNLDQNFIGVPTEGFAFSNNSFGSFAPPKYNQAKFNLPENSYVTQTVTLKFY
jgi:uncharacterized protein (DUF2141 family)